MARDSGAGADGTDGNPRAGEAHRLLGPVGALRFSLAKAGRVIRLTMRVVAWTLLTIAPFGVVGAVAYYTLLTQYDINFYLKEKPPVFWVAVVIGGVVVAALVAVLLRLFTGWFFALPLVLFENVSPADALELSKQRAHGHRRTLLFWIVGWWGAMAVLSALATGIVGLLGRCVVPDSASSLRLLAATIGITLLLWTIVNLAINLLSTTTFAAMLFNLYRKLGGGERGCGALEIASSEEGKSGPALNRRRLIAWGRGWSGTRRTEPSNGRQRRTYCSRCAQGRRAGRADSARRDAPSPRRHARATGTKPSCCLSPASTASTHCWARSAVPDCPWNFMWTASPSRSLGGLTSPSTASSKKA